MIIKKEKLNNVDIYYVDKDITDDAMEKMVNGFIKPKHIKLIINKDTDVYTKDNKLLLRFRKNKLPKNDIKDFYDNVIDFAKRKTSNRGSATGSKNKSVGTNPKIMTNILGYMDGFSPSQKAIMTRTGNKINLLVRETKFKMDFPENYKKIIPYTQEINKLYKKYIPKHFHLQMKKAKETYFKIDNTAFTTITTNINFQTSIHKDRGDDSEGFGNLTVIENGEYTGGETCFPQYGIGVNIRTGDILFMDVHEYHGNLPIKLIDKDAIRLSIVCYLRTNIWKKTRKLSKKKMIKHNNTVKRLREIA